MKVSIIAAIGENRELGKNNKLLWHIKEDLQRFKALTLDHPIIMGRKTWESLPFKPLPNRTNIVVTRDISFAGGGLAKLAGSLEEAIEVAKRHSGKRSASRIDSGQARMTSESSEEIFIIGGGQIYEQAIKKGLADKLYLTIVDGKFDADTFFPDYSEFKEVVFEKSHDNGKYKYTFLDLQKAK